MTTTTLPLRCDAAANREVFAHVAETYRPQIFRFLLASLRDVELAETLTQECFLRAFEHWSGFRGDANVSTWLMRIAVNLQKDHWRSRRMQFWRRVSAHSVDADDARDWLPSREASPEQQVSARQQAALVWRSVDRLTHKQRTVFLLRVVEGLKIAEISESTGMREGTVKAHLARAMANVRAALQQERPQ